MAEAPLFTSEAALCAAFLAEATKDGAWRAYPETAGFDILMVRAVDGAQIGIEAKLVLNAKVVAQALPDGLHYNAAAIGPDFRAVLVPDGKVRGEGLGRICAALGITVITFRGTPPRGVYFDPFAPGLPRVGSVADDYYNHSWHEWAPQTRCELPDYVPDVAAGASAPIALTDWKVRAIKLAVLLEERPVTRSDFKALGLSPSRWTDPFTGWLEKTASGYLRGAGMPNFQAQHPRNYAEIKADKAIWAPASAPALVSTDLFGASHGRL